jgi:hypothetical protein
MLEMLEEGEKRVPEELRSKSEGDFFAAELNDLRKEFAPKERK